MHAAQKPIPSLLSDHKFAGSRKVNLLGAHVMRTLVARLLHYGRRVAKDPAIQQRAEVLRRDGVLVWTNFLPEGAFDALSAEVLEVLEKRPQAFWCCPGHAHWARAANVDKLGPSVLPETFRFLQDPRLRSLLELAQRRRWEESFQRADLQLVTQGSDPREDEQTDPHVDTFFHLHNAWFYLTDVGPQDGCLAVIKGSHRLSIRSLWRGYRHSLDPARHQSRGVSAQDILREGLEETPIISPRNTLVVANVHAIHRRLPGRPGAVRLALHITNRVNPFTLPSSPLLR